MSSIQKPRGTQDIFFHDFYKFDFIIKTAEFIAKKHNFYTLKPPTFESVELFERNIGEDTDAISKELYRFEDRGKRKLALRPEFTAGIMRAYLENKTLYTHPISLRLFSSGSLFRYDRPKKGRFREFHQINFELLHEKEDINTIAIAVDLLKNLGILHKVKLIINYLGSAKIPYTQAVKEYFTQHISSISEVSRTRLHKNPLRILDSKEPEDIILLENCPKISPYYSQDDKKQISEITSFLTKSNINFEVSSSLVRGLDYYTGIVFEFIAPIAEDGSDMTVLGGGRYDNLVAQMGGEKQVNAIGFSGGVERLSLLLQNVKSNNKIFLLNITNHSESILQIINNLSQRKEYHHASFQVINVEKNKIGKTLQKLGQMNNSHAIVIGETELSNKKALLKDLTTLESEEVIL